MTTPHLLDLDKDTFSYLYSEDVPDYERTQCWVTHGTNGPTFNAVFQEWLKRGEPFQVRGTVGLKLVSFTVRVKQLPESKGQWWYAQGRVNGKNRQKYIGLACNIDVWKLEVVLRHFDNIRIFGAHAQGV